MLCRSALPQPVAVDRPRLLLCMGDGFGVLEDSMLDALADTASRLSAAGATLQDLVPHVVSDYHAALAQVRSQRRRVLDLLEQYDAILAPAAPGCSSSVTPTGRGGYLPSPSGSSRSSLDSFSRRVIRRGCYRRQNVRPRQLPR